jgi:hypothetical protein
VARVIERAVDIDASAEHVWSVLADLGKFSQWNPFMTSVQGELKVGARPEVHIVPPGGRGMTFSPTVLAVEPNRVMRWLGKVGFRGLFDGEHSWTIVPREGGGVRFVNHERFSGLLVPLFSRTLDQAEHGFDAMNRALKERAEAPPP